jgi:hypothetical protein
MGGAMARWVSDAYNKYQEAIYDQTALFAQPHIDECALASMGKLWEGESFDGSTIYIKSSLEEIVLDSFYFILKYAKSGDPLNDALKANRRVCGEHDAREVLIKVALG